MKIVTEFPPRSESIAAVGEQVRRRERTSVELVERCLRRIDELESRVRAWVIVDRTGALDQARKLDAELAAGRWRGPLHGIPIGIKDIIDVAGFPTSAGSKLLEDNIAKSDSTIVERLREAGAVILGKTVTTQFASFDPPVTRNPWNLDRTPGGSSSGSAAAVACGMCLGAIGSQTGGSITRPASFCGVAGCKPTFGRVSTAGVMALAPSMDHPGPIASCVRDLAILLDAIAGPDPRDPLCLTDPPPRAAVALDRPLDRPPRLGVLRDLFWDRADESAREALTRTIDLLKGRGAEIREVALPPSFSDVLRSHMVIMSVEGAVEHATLFQQHRGDYLPKIRGLIEQGLNTIAPDYVRAKQHQRILSREILACFADVDALLTPATISPAPDTSTTGDPAFNSPWSFTGLPTVSILVCVGGEGLPLAIQMIDKPNDEAELLRVALWCEDCLLSHRRVNTDA
jgi:aspartyl-tRNA(Asn)/glutamyl-tRNA(Gln) amidotransferase subunit A